MAEPVDPRYLSARQSVVFLAEQTVRDWQQTMESHGMDEFQRAALLGVLVSTIETAASGAREDATP